MQMAEKIYKMSRTVAQAYCDHRHEARLSYLLATAQQISMEHCDSVDVGGTYFHERGLVFLLAKLHLELYHPICGGELLGLVTSPNLPHKAQYRRLTDFCSADGRLLATMDARWVLVDIDSRRLLRRLPEGIELPFLDAEELVDIRPALPAEMEQCDEVRVRYSMLDINGHMNNTVYGDLVANQLEQQLMDDKRITSVDIFYHREALLGDLVTLWRSFAGERFFVKGCVGDSVCFEAQGTLGTV